MQALVFSILTKPNVIEQFAVDAVMALLLEKKSAYAIADLELSLCLWTNLDYRADILVRWADRTLRFVDTLPDLASIKTRSSNDEGDVLT